MRVLHISYDVSKQSAAYRIHCAMRKMGIESYIYVARECLDEKYIIAPKPNGYAQKVKHKLKSHLFGLIDRILKKIFIQSDGMLFSMNMFSTFDRRIVESINPDIINLHWICNNFISYKDLAYLCKRYHVVWTCHDSWPFTGGCHIPLDCLDYKVGCNTCRYNKNQFRSISSFIIKKKINSLDKKKITVVSPSRWLASCAESSRIFNNQRVCVIPNAIDISSYKPVAKEVARDILNVPDNKKVILFGAMNATGDPNKGFCYLKEAINILSSQQRNIDDVLLLVFGSSTPDKDIDWGYQIRYLGRLYDNMSLMTVYNAADVMIVPSKSENLPNTIMEAMACGTPCVGFRIGGIPDEIEHMVTGYLAEPFDTSDLAKGIETVLENHEKMGMAARDKAAREYNMQKVGQQYLDLYEEILSDGK